MSCSTPNKNIQNIQLTVLLIFHDSMGCGYGKCPKIAYTKAANKMAYAKSSDPAPKGKEQSDQGLHCLPFSQRILRNNCIKDKNLGKPGKE